MEDSGKSLPPPDNGVTPTGDPTGIKTLGETQASSEELGEHEPPEEESGFVGAPGAAGGGEEPAKSPKMPAAGSNPDVYDN